MKNKSYGKIKHKRRVNTNNIAISNSMSLNGMIGKRWQQLTPKEVRTMITLIRNKLDN